MTYPMQAAPFPKGEHFSISCSLELLAKIGLPFDDDSFLQEKLKMPRPYLQTDHSFSCCYGSITLLCYVISWSMYV